MLVIVFEWSKGAEHNWAIKSTWTLAVIMGAIKLQTMRSLERHRRLQIRAVGLRRRLRADRHHRDPGAVLRRAARGVRATDLGLRSVVGSP